MSSYTYTDVSLGFFDKAAELFRAYSDRMTFKVLDIEKAPAAQGFEPHSYDIIIASNCLHATAPLQRTLDNTRQLLKPGGYLMLMEVTSNDALRRSNIMGGLPGWWVGVDDGRKYAPTITPKQWHTALRKAGFSGVEAITPEIDILPWPLSIMAVQAVDDRVDFLRRPLSHRLSSTSIYLESLVILGAGGLECARIAEEVQEHLGLFCGQITVLDGLPTEAEALALNPMSTFINLTDIESPIFKSLTPERMDGLKRFLELAKHILWITLGAQADEPYHMASIAFSRTIRQEAGHISLNHLDVSDLEHNVSKVIAEHLLRQCALDEWEVPRDSQQRQQFLWSKETEVFLDRGHLMIPRLVDNVAQNARLNSSRREITKTVPMSSSNVSISTSAHSPPSLVEPIPAMEFKNGQSLVRVESSSLVALHVAADTFLYLGIGKDVANEGTVVVLSSMNSSKRVPIASVPAGAQSVHQSADGLLIAVASELLATSLIQALPSGSSILVHCSGKDRFLAAALSRQAAAKRVRVTFSCDAECADSVQDATWIKLSARAPRHLVRRMLLCARPTHYLDLTVQSQTHASELSLNIAQVLSSGCKRIDQSDLSQHQSMLSPSSSREVLKGRLEDAVSSAGLLTTSTAQEQVQDLIIQLDNYRDLPMANHTTRVVHWPLDKNIEVEVHPLDARGLFSQDKTYLLVGLTGEIGRSICEWMISNGAGCVCLTSRSPKISTKWLESFQGTNATVRIFAMYVNKTLNDGLRKDSANVSNYLGTSLTRIAWRQSSMTSEPAAPRLRVWPMERWSSTTQCFQECLSTRCRRLLGPRSMEQTISIKFSTRMTSISFSYSHHQCALLGTRVKLTTPQQMVT